MAQNEEKRIRKTLESIKDIADEIVIIDGGSIDGTISVAREYTKNIFVNKFEGYAKQRQFALSKVQCDWVLAIDADETLSKELHDAIRKLISQNEFDAFEFSRKNFIKPGVWLQYGGMYPDYQRRLFRRKFSTYGDIVHAGEVPKIQGSVKSVNLDIHHDQSENNIQYHWAKLLNFVRSEIKDTKVVRWFGFYLFQAFKDLLLVFTKKYLFQKGYKMGFLGIRVATSHALLRFLVNVGLCLKRFNQY